MNNSITVKKLTKSYKLYEKPIDRLKESLSISGKIYHKKFFANKHISFTIKKGEVVGIIGLNGCGKSTLLKMIAGVLTPSSGTIAVSGKITALLELGAGFNPEMTGLSNLYLAGSISGLSKKKMDRRISKIIDFAEIGQFIHQPLKTYSSGMKSRLAFAFSIHSEPEILIVDEALSVGDSAFQRKCYAKIEDMCKSETITVLFVSHSGGAIKQLCNRAIFLHNGELIIDGDPKNVVHLYEKFASSKKTDIVQIQNEYKKINDNKRNNQTKQTTHSYYNPNVKSKSLVELPQNGARISDIKLTDSSGNKVNILNKNETYTYSYIVKYFDNYDKVKVNMRITNIKGIEVTGRAQYIENVIKDKSYLINFKFTNKLNDGEYFFKCGTNTKLYGDFIILHRIVDAYMVKVNSDNDDNSKGLVDMDLEFTFKTI